MAVSVKQIFEGTGIVPDSSLEKLEINALQYDSRKVNPGDLFIAVKGFESDGHDYAAMAVDAGAAAVVSEKPLSLPGIPQITVKDSRRLMSRLAFNFYQEAFEKTGLIGITGTNGKTTTSFLIRSILNAAGGPTGLIGTIAYYFKDRKIDAWNTTPEAIDIAKILQDMSAEGLKNCVIEVSSHALALHRVDAFPFKVAVFTNLSHDHLDFHKDLESYFKAKKKLFSLISQDGVAVINQDDPYSERIRSELKVPHLSFGFSESADVRVVDWINRAAGTEMTIKTRRKTFRVKSDLVSLFNIQNILAAVAAAQAMNINEKHIIEGIAELKQVPGRLESYEVRSEIRAVIDYAHTPDALKKTADALRSITKNRLITVFGCGGDRDQEKRPLMGRIAEQVSDFVIVTSDNPRSEDPDKIIKHIVSGMSDPKKREIISNRKEAIFYAIKTADAGDTVLIAGKGHEPYQIIDGKRYDFDEAEIIKEAAADA